MGFYSYTIVWGLTIYLEGVLQIMGRSRVSRSCLTIFMALLLVTGMVAPPGAFTKPAAAGYSAADMAAMAVSFINEQYQDGKKIDGYTAYVLSLAGEDLAAAKWENGRSVKQEILEQSDLLGDNRSLITYICATQNDDGSFGPYANEYGTKAPLQALAAVRGELTGSIRDMADEAIDKAVEYFAERYQSGDLTYKVDGFNFDYRCIEALADAGVDLSAGQWITGGVSLGDGEQSVGQSVYDDDDSTSLREIALASANAAAEAVQLNPEAADPVYLAKELTVLCALDPDSDNINVLADAIIGSRHDSGDEVSFGSDVYGDVLVLTALGKAGRINDLDQDKVLAYLNNYKHEHKDSWGNSAGAAWGGWDPEEPDLTAQVVTALGYFSKNDNLEAAIEDGLAYLADIQDDDTAAIPARWDSTFATAETLMALKALGKTEGYTGQSGWIKNSRTKSIAQHLLAVSQWQDNQRRDRLAGLLAGRQKTADPGKGSFENSVYSDVWAYIALGEAGKIDILDTGSAKNYILNKQNDDGSWGETFGGAYYPDVLSTIQALRALDYLPEAAGQEVQDATGKGLAYLRGLQKENGGVYSDWDDPAVSNSEFIVALRQLDVDPAADWKNAQGLTPVDCLLNSTLNQDGSFGTSKNITGATSALAALLPTGGQGGPGGVITQPPAEEDGCSVDIAVVGENGELLYGPDSVFVSKEGRWGLTALGALDATGLEYTENGGMVTSIAGQANRGMNGWMYKVNNSIPSMSASAKTVKKDDRVIWWYSKDMSSPGPTWDSLSQQTITEQLKTETPASLVEQNKLFPVELQASDEALKILEKINQLISVKDKPVASIPPGEHNRAVVVVGSGGDPAGGPIQVLALRKELAQKTVDITQKVAAGAGAVIGGPGSVVGLCIPAGALTKDMDITVKKVAAVEDQSDSRTPAPQDFVFVSDIYHFGPDGTKFAVPATISLKLVIPPLIRAEDLALACYDQDGRWVIVPAVVDLDKGLILANVSHFSRYAVLAREPVKTFADVTGDSADWAREAIQKLAGAGILTGVDEANFEPEREVTRAEFAGMLVKALGIKEHAVDGQVFRDVLADRWYHGVVNAASAAGLIKGYEDGTFHPDGSITREEVAVILARSMQLQDAEEKLTFIDSDQIAGWARSGVAGASREGLIRGFPDGAFRPKATASRAQCAVMVYKLMTGQR